MTQRQAPVVQMIMHVLEMRWLYMKSCGKAELPELISSKYYLSIKATQRFIKAGAYLYKT